MEEEKSNAAETVAVWVAVICFCVLCAVGTAWVVARIWPW